jgi:hypothetical protein
LPQILRQFKEENASRVFAFRSCPSLPNLFQNLPLSVKRKKNSKRQILKETLKQVQCDALRQFLATRLRQFWATHAFASVLYDRHNIDAKI